METPAVIVHWAQRPGSDGHQADVAASMSVSPNTGRFASCFDLASPRGGGRNRSRIQIDEPALREGLPLRKAQRRRYREWAVKAFRIAASGVADATRSHTHMRYAQFNDIIDSVAALDADVIPIKTSRSCMELLDAFARFDSPNQAGPGVYDIHTPRIPERTDRVELLRRAAEVLPAESRGRTRTAACRPAPRWRR